MNANRCLGARLWSLALACVPLAVSAAEEPPGTPEIVVTASRVEQPRSAALAPLTIITRADIERLQPPSLMELLASTPGALISNSGGRGKAGSVFLRGTGGGQTAVLMDGVRIGSVSVGAPALPYIPLDQIERIEIVRGPFSSLYGSDAIGGVIQVFTRRGGVGSSSNASVGVGSHGMQQAALGASTASEQGWASVQASHERTDGINACRVGAAGAFAGCFVDRPDRDGFRNSALTLNGGYRFDSAWSVDGVAFRSQGRSDVDVFSSDRTDYSIQTVGGQLHYQPSEDVKLSMRGGSSTDFSTNRLDGAATDHFDSRRSVASLQADVALAPGLLSIGYDWERQSLASSTQYEVDQRIIRGLFAQWQASLGVQSLQASLRRDDNSQFGGKTTGSVLWGWDLSDELRLSANYGTAFRAPTFNDLYYPGYGKATLRPESSRTLQLALRGTPDWGHWSIEAYRNEIRDLIEFDAASYSPGNIGRARIVGIDAVLGGQWLGWSLRSTASLMRPRNETAHGLNRGNLLPRRARRMLNLEADRPFGRLNIGASWRLVDRRYDDIGNRNALGGYGLLDLRAGWLIDAAWRVDLALNNALDKNYETAWYFNQPGRTYMLTLSWRPQH